MPQNLELKARVSSLQKAADVAANIGARFAGSFQHADTYFKVRSGRLKLREINSKEAELIYYERPNQKGGRYSNYTIVCLTDIPETKKFFRLVFKPLVVVKKKRKLYLYRNARIHLDVVRGLGEFIEFEVLVTKGKPQALRMLGYLRTVFDIEPKSIIGFSYGDLLMRNRR
ncbi:MAG: class IV adenylate cyclase [Ignavibacteriales bacterium]|nr:class IV adenylate cyclase [Ignavibacteriales bacterium]